ncbi:hypothetical protein SH2C18_27630 [Clostridium sediminicola]|uniref:hypothetical protein n=1 Tax=Clostridium sediminicola TaxID=3114879 RepID=UPI0031F24637
MKSFRNNVLLSVYLSLMVCSTIVNVLFCSNIVSESLVQIGFTLVILCGILVNYLSLKAHNVKSGKGICEKRSILTTVISVVIVISWAVSYGMTVFLK